MKHVKDIWLEFRNQALLDLDAMKCLYEAGNYGNSAYHAQQAMEKLVKAIILQDDANVNVKDMGHVVCSWKMLDRFQTSVNVMGDLNHDYWEEFGKIVDQGFDSIKNLFKESENVKIEWWQHSLGFMCESNPDVESYFKIMKSIGKILASFVSLGLIPSILKEYGNQYTPKEFDQKKSQMLACKDEFLKRINESNITILSIKQILETWPPDAPKSEIRHIILILSFSGLLLKLYPHEEIGRYPQNIEDVSSLQLYADRYEYLLSLEQEVEDAFDELDSMFFSGNLDR